MTLLPHDAVCIATAGEALIDLVRQPDGRYLPCPGGAVFNLSRALARQGTGVAYLNPLSGDRFGRQLADILQADGAHLARPVPVHEPTSLAVIGVNAQGHPDFNFYRAGVADRCVTAEGLRQAAAAWPAVEVVCTGCLALDPADAHIYVPWLQAEKAAGRWVVVDANLRAAVMPDLAPYRANVHRALALADLIKVSDEDLQVLAVPGADSLERARHLFHSVPARMLALTQGGEGAVLMLRTPTGTRVLHGRDPGPVTVVDTVGAGDSFLAGLLSPLVRLARQRSQSVNATVQTLEESDLGSLLAHALATASINVMRSGCEPPFLHEVHDRLRAHPPVPVNGG